MKFARILPQRGASLASFPGASTLARGDLFAGRGFLFWLIGPYGGVVFLQSRQLIRMWVPPTASVLMDPTSRAGIPTVRAGFSFGGA